MRTPSKDADVKVLPAQGTALKLYSQLASHGQQRAERPDQSPTVSLVMTVYNTEAYLAEALASVLAQTFADWELIIWDDGSTDSSAAIARQLETRLTGENANVQTFSADIAGGSFLSTFLIANGTDVNSNQIYFSHLGANANGNDHIKLLGNNTFGFEDMAGLGDKDYNDIVVQFTATKPVVLG